MTISIVNDNNAHTLCNSRTEYLRDGDAGGVVVDANLEPVHALTAVGLLQVQQLALLVPDI